MSATIYTPLYHLNNSMATSGSEQLFTYSDSHARRTSINAANSATLNTPSPYRDIPAGLMSDNISECRLNGDAALAELVFLDRLCTWAANIVRHPEKFFTAAELAVIHSASVDLPHEVDFYRDPYGVRAQQGLDAFHRLIEWGENLTREGQESEWKMQQARCMRGHTIPAYQLRDMIGS